MVVDEYGEGEGKERKARLEGQRRTNSHKLGRRSKAWCVNHGRGAIGTVEACLSLSLSLYCTVYTYFKVLSPPPHDMLWMLSSMSKGGRLRHRVPAVAKLPARRTPHSSLMMICTMDIMYLITTYLLSSSTKGGRPQQQGGDAILPAPVSRSF